jgi:hypothetical protein
MFPASIIHREGIPTNAGVPAYVGKAPRFKMTNTGLGIDVDIQNHNAIQGSFLFEG